MKTLCAWCGMTLKEEGESNGLDNHGICVACATRLESDCIRETGNPAESAMNDPASESKIIRLR